MTATTATASEALERGDLDAAVAAALSGVRAAPDDRDARALLIDLLIVAGEHERADRQADILSNLAPDLAVGLSLLRGYLRAAEARRAWFEEGAVPAFPDGPSERDELALRLGVALRDSGDASEALNALAERSETTVTVNGGRPVPFRDADDRVPHAVEVLGGNGSYVWVDLGRIERVEFAPPRVVRDLAWRPARMRLRDGAESDVVLAMTYHAANPTPAERLARETNWDEERAIPLGRGQKAFLAGDEAVYAADLRRLEIAE